MGEPEAKATPELATDPKIKKGVKDLALPVKPAAAKCCLGLADGVRKAASPEEAKEARRQMGLRVEEKGKVWDGGVVPMMVAALGQSKEKPVTEAISLAAALALADSKENIALAEAEGVEKVMVGCCRDKSLLVQAHACMAIGAVASAGTPDNLARLVSEGAMKALTTIAGAEDSAKTLEEQGVNKQIAYTCGQRQEEAAAALHQVTTCDAAKDSAMQTGTLQTLIELAANNKVIKIVGKKETTETPAATARAKVEAVGALLNCATAAHNRELLAQLGGIAPLVALLSHPEMRARERAAGTIHQMCLQQSLRGQVISANGVAALLALCNAADATTLALMEAGGALQCLANEEAAKPELARRGAAATLCALLSTVKPAGDEAAGAAALERERAVMAEHALAVLAHMCVHGNGALDNTPRAVLLLNETGNARLQDACAHTKKDGAEGSGVVEHVARLCAVQDAAVSGQAVAAMAALCCRHADNAREAGRCRGPKVAMALLLQQTDDDVRIANVILALQCMAEGFAGNVPAMLRMGATARLLALHRLSASPQVEG